MVCASRAHAEEANGATAYAQGCVPAIPLTARRAGDPTDQPDTARLGELFRHRTLRQVLLLHSTVGRKEDSTPYGSIPETMGLRLEEME